MTLTREQLDEIAEGCSGVTPGPWDTSAAMVRAIDGDVAIPLLEIIEPWKFRRHTSTAVRQAWLNQHHIARLDPTTVLELVRLARLGMEKESGNG